MTYPISEALLLGLAIEQSDNARELGRRLEAGFAAIVDVGYVNVPAALGRLERAELVERISGGFTATAAGIASYRGWLRQYLSENPPSGDFVKQLLLMTARDLDVALEIFDAFELGCLEVAPTMPLAHLEAEMAERAADAGGVIVVIEDPRDRLQVYLQWIDDARHYLMQEDTQRPSANGHDAARV